MTAQTHPDILARQRGTRMLIASLTGDTAARRVALMDAATEGAASVALVASFLCEVGTKWMRAAGEEQAVAELRAALVDLAAKTR